MREIKFRVWDEKTEKWKKYVTRNIIININCGPELVQQYTGLRDMYGKEIYEGDIVKAWSQGDCGSFEIVWRQASTPCWILYPAWRGEFWHLHGTLREDGRWHDNVEVIGNIHENPELLSLPTPREQIPDGGIEE